VISPKVVTPVPPVMAASNDAITLMILLSVMTWMQRVELWSWEQAGSARVLKLLMR